MISVSTDMREVLGILLYQNRIGCEYLQFHNPLMREYQGGIRDFFGMHKRVFGCILNSVAFRDGGR